MMITITLLPKLHKRSNRTRDLQVSGWQQLASNVSELELFLSCYLNRPDKCKPVIPTTEINRVKVKSNDTLENLIFRVVVRGDIQDNSYSSIAPFRSLKEPLVDAEWKTIRFVNLIICWSFSSYQWKKNNTLLLYGEEVLWWAMCCCFCVQCT